jgi:hypothetical protein
VLAVIYLIYNEGYSGRLDIGAEAIRLGRVLAALMPDEPEAHGLLALMMIHHAQRRARFSGEDLVLLDDQDRGLDEMIISLYAGGMTVRDIQHHLARTLGTELSHDTISTITDAVLEEVKAWQSRPLEEIYPVIYPDALVVKVGARPGPRPLGSNGSNAAQRPSVRSNRLAAGIVATRSPDAGVHLAR